MYTYFNNQPFLNSLSTNASLINSLKKKNKQLSVAVCVMAVGMVLIVIKTQWDISRAKGSNGIGYRLY